MTRFGVEEEFVLLDHDALAPVGLGPPAREVISREDLPGSVSTEFLTCQIEYATSPVKALAEAGSELHAFRSRLMRFAARHNAVSAGTGTPWGTGPSATTTPSARYHSIATWLGDITGGHQVNGMHVHVEIADDEERIRALNALRPWLPVLLALSANSPFWHRRDTDYDSWRSILLRRLPTMGCPPPFEDAEHYRSVVDQLVELGAAHDIASVAWAARASDRFPTVEVRVFDAQITVDDTLLLTSLTRALLVSASPPTRHLGTAAIDAALWMAGREGLEGGLLHPESGAVVDTRALVALLLDTVTPALEAAGDLAFAQDHLARILTDGNGARRQRRAFSERGIDGLRTLLRGEAEPV